MSWQDTAAKELAEEQDITDELDDVEIKDYAPGDGVYIEFAEVGDVTKLHQSWDQFVVFQDSADAERAAYDDLEERLDELYYDGFPDWAEQFMTPDLVAIREYALSDADSHSQDIDDERALEEAGLEDDHEALQTERDEIEEEEDDKEREMLDLDGELSDAEYGPRAHWDVEKADNLRERIDAMQNRIDEIQARVSEIEGEQEALVEKAREKVNEEHYERVYEEMSSDIVRYLKDHFGYGTKEIRDSGFASYDERAMAEYVVDNDGVASIFSSDGEEIDLPSGAVAYRTN